MTLDLSPAWTRAQEIAHGLLLAVPSVVAKRHEGTVEDIQTRATFIRTYDGRRGVIPNADLFTDTVVVNTAFPQRRLEYDVGIVYGEDVEQARGLMLKFMQSVDGVPSDPAPDVLVMELAGSSVNLRARWWIAPPQKAEATDGDRIRQREGWPAGSGPSPGPRRSALVRHATVGGASPENPTP